MTKTVIVLALLASAVSTAVAAERRHSTNPTYDVYAIDGTYAGSDPDPNVRNMLRRDPLGQ